MNINKNIFNVQSACHSRYIDLIAFVGKDNKIYLGKKTNYDSEGHYDNSDNSLLFISENKNTYIFLYGDGCIFSQEEALNKGIYTKEDYAEFSRIQNNILLSIKDKLKEEFCFDGKPFNGIFERK